MRIKPFHLPPWRTLAGATLGALMLAGRVSAQPVPATASPAVSPAANLSLATAEGALAAGLAGVAALQYEELLRMPSLPVALTREARLGLASARLAEGRWSEAREVLQGLPETDARLRLRLLLARLHQQGGPEGLRPALAAIDPATLPSGEIAWWHLAKGMVLEAENDPAARDEAFAEAQRLAASDEQKAQFELFRYRGKLRRGPLPTEESLNQLRQRAERERDRPGGFQWAETYAIELARSGQTARSVQILEEMLSLASSNQNGARGDLRLLLALIQGPQKTSGQKALDDILKDQNLPVTLQRLALNLMVSELGGDGDQQVRDNLDARLYKDRWNTPTGLHPLADEIRERLSFIYLQAKMPERAREILADWETSVRERLGASFATTPQRRHLLRQAGLIAWQRGQFQAAALVLGELHDLLETPAEKARLALFQGDALFNSESFAAAAAAYENAWKDGRAADSAEILGPAYRQRIQSLLEASRVAEAASGAATEAGRAAEAATRQAEVSSRVAEAVAWADAEGPRCPDLAARWQSEWNLSQRLRSIRRTAAALERVTRLASSTDPASPPELRARLLWLQAELSLDTGNHAAVPTLLAQLRETVSAIPLTFEARDDIISRSALLEGRALLEKSAGDPAAVARAREVFTGLRDEFGTSKSAPARDSAASSLLVEARFLAAHNQPLDAETAVNRLREDYPDSRYTPVALYEAAILRERRGLAGPGESGSGGGIYESAAQRLNRNQPAPETPTPPDPQHPSVLLKELINKYKRHPLVFYALLRLANYARSEATPEDYNDADKLCDQILKDFANHPEIHRAEMTKADCQFALGSTSSLQYNEAFSLYERLHDNSALPADFRIEAGCKMVETARARGDRGASVRLAESVLQNVEAQGTNRIEVARLGVTGRYWLSRTLFVQAEQLELEGKNNEAQRACQRILDLQLPGAPLATATLARLRPPSLPAGTPAPETPGK